MTLTTIEQIAVVERLIEEFRWARSTPAVPEHATYNVLKALASDLRARLPLSPVAARLALGERIARAVNAKGDQRYYTDGDVRAIAEELIGRWPVVEQALERFEREVSMVEVKIPERS